MSKKKRDKTKAKPVKVVKPVYDRKELKIILSILALGFVIRLIYILETQSSPFIQNLFSDSKIYYDWAKDLSNSGHWFGKRSILYVAGLSILFSNYF